MVINLLINTTIQTIAKHGLEWALKRQLKRRRSEIYYKFGKCRYYALHFHAPTYLAPFIIGSNTQFQFKLNNEYIYATSIIVDNDFKISTKPFYEYFAKEIFFISYI